MSLIAQSTVYPRPFCLGATGLSPVVTISKAGAAFGAAAGAVSEIGSTWYKVLLTVIDTETLGDLAYHITAAGADDLDMCDQVVEAPVGALTAAYDAAKAAAAPGAAMTLTAGERNAVADAHGARTLPEESYAADGAVPTWGQIQYMMWAALAQFGIAGVTISAKKLDGTTEAMTFTMDDAVAPTSRVRAT